MLFLQVVVYEQTSHLGGVWVFDTHTDVDPLGKDPGRGKVRVGVLHAARAIFACIRTCWKTTPAGVRWGSEGV